MSPRRVVMNTYGPPSVLRWEDAPERVLQRGEVRLRTLAAAVNHSDLEIRSGAWPILRATPFPYVPGLEVVGEIIERGPLVSSCAVGDRAITMMQGLGGVRAERDGGYAEEVIVAAEAIAVVDAGVDPLALAAIGLAGVTAAEGLAKIARVSGALGSGALGSGALGSGASGSGASGSGALGSGALGSGASSSLAGLRVLVSGAGGGVGSAAVAIGRSLGAQVTAIVSRAEQREHAMSLGASEVLVARTAEQLDPQLRAGSFDGVLDCVAGPLFPALVNALRRHGTLSLVGAVGGSKVALEAYDLLFVTLTGYSSEDLDGPSLRRAIEPITAAMRANMLPAPPTTVLPLRDAARAHDMLERHEVSGRIVLVPA